MHCSTRYPICVFILVSLATLTFASTAAVQASPSGEEATVQEPTAAQRLADSPLLLERLETRWLLASEVASTAAVDRPRLKGLVRDIGAAIRAYNGLGGLPGEMARLRELRREVETALVPPRARALRAPSAQENTASDANKVEPASVEILKERLAKMDPIVLQGSDACADAPLIEIGDFSGNTLTATPDGLAACSSTPFAGPDIWYRIFVPENETFFLSTEGSDFDTVLSVQITCEDERVLECNDDADDQTQSSSLRFSSSTAQEVLVRIAGDFYEAGHYRLSVKRGGEIHGRILSESGEPLSQIRARLRSDQTSDSIDTGEDGSFIFSALPPGAYTLSADPFGELYLPQLYANIPCPDEFGCVPEEGTPIPVDFNEIVELEDIRLVLGGTIEGQVRIRETGAGAIDSTTLSIHRTGDFFPRTTTTIEDGRYSLDGLPAGDYRVSASSFGDFVDQAWDNFNCGPFGCELDDGSLLSLSEGQTRSDIDFELIRLSSVRGQVRNTEQAPLIAQRVTLYDLDFTPLASAFTGSQGSFNLGTVQPGTYYATAGESTFTPYVRELFSEVPCTVTPLADCDFSLGTAFEVGPEAEVEGIDFTLSRGGQLSGQITDRDSGQPVGNLEVRLSTAGGATVGRLDTDAQGRYQFQGLAGGEYLVRTLSSPFEPTHVDAIYPGLPCLEDCPTDQATPIRVDFEEVVMGVDFALFPTSTVRGRVTSAATGAPLPGLEVEIPGSFLPSARTDADGRYELPFQVPGSLRLTVVTSDFLRVTQTVEVELGQDLDGVDFALEIGGRIAGAFFNQDGAPLDSTFNMVLYDESFTPVQSEFFNTPQYMTRPLEPGSYYVFAENDLIFISQLWPRINCIFGRDIEDCAGAQLVTVREGETTTGIDFTFNSYATIQGRVIDAESGAALTGVSVQLYDAEAQNVNSAQTSFDDLFTFRRLEAGDYYLIAQPRNNAGRYSSQVFGGPTCLDELCDPTSGTPVRVDFGENKGGIQISVQRGGGLTGRLRNSDGSFLGSNLQVIGIFTAEGAPVTTTFTTESGWSIDRLPSGSYRLLAADFTGSRFDQVLGGGACISGQTCDLSSGTAVTVRAGQAIGGLDFIFQSVEPISGRIVDQESGQPIEGVTVQQWELDGTPAGSAVTDADGRYSLRFRPSSYLTTTSSAEYQDVVWPDVACPGGNCSSVLGRGQAVTPIPGAPVQGIDFALGPPTECGSSTELCTLNERFRVSVRWATDDAQGQGGAVPLTDESGYFWFFDPANVEVVIKTLDACDGFGHFWVFSAGLTNVQVEITVLDTFTGATRVYRHAPGQLFQPIFDTSAFATCSALAPITSETSAYRGSNPATQSAVSPGLEGKILEEMDKLADQLEKGDDDGLPAAEISAVTTPAEKACQPANGAVCLTDDRFLVEATFRIDGADIATAQAVELTSDTAYFWFFDPNNVEVVLKVLDACDGFDRYWIFAAGLTNVEVKITVTNTENGAIWTYDNSLGNDFAPVADTGTLFCQ